jgi:transposase-like protein
MSRKKGSKDYPLKTKLEAIRLWQEEGVPQKEITERMGIRDPKRVRVWLRSYRKEGEEGLKKPRRGRPPKGRHSLEARIKQLEMENTLLKALAFELGEELLEGLDIRPSTDTEGNSK